jgi:hypothetical protein
MRSQVVDSASGMQSASRTLPLNQSMNRSVLIEPRKIVRIPISGWG